jgi:hypothetical protein
VSRLCGLIYERVGSFLAAPPRGRPAYVRRDAVRPPIVSVAAIIAVDVNTDGRREASGGPPQQKFPTRNRKSQETMEQYVFRLNRKVQPKHMKLLAKIKPRAFI